MQISYLHKVFSISQLLKVLEVRSSTGVNSQTKNFFFFRYVNQSYPHIYTLL